MVDAGRGKEEAGDQEDVGHPEGFRPLDEAVQDRFLAVAFSTPRVRMHHHDQQMQKPLAISTQLRVDCRP